MHECIVLQPDSGAPAASGMPMAPPVLGGLESEPPGSSAGVGFGEEAEGRARRVLPGAGRAARLVGTKNVFEEEEEEEEEVVVEEDPTFAIKNTRVCTIVYRDL